MSPDPVSVPPQGGSEPDPLVVDARGQRCPLPVIRLARAAQDVEPGSVIELWATDPAARADVPAWCRMRGQEFLGEVPGTETGTGTDTGTGTGTHTAYRVRTAP